MKTANEEFIIGKLFDSALVLCIWFTKSILTETKMSLTKRIFLVLVCLDLGFREFLTFKANTILFIVGNIKTRQMFLGSGWFSRTLRQSYHFPLYVKQGHEIELGYLNVCESGNHENR